MVGHQLLEEMVALRDIFSRFPHKQAGLGCQPRGGWQKQE